MLQRQSSRERGRGDTFEEGVRADLTEKFKLEQILEGGGQGGDRGQSEAMVRVGPLFWMERKPLECFKQ